MSSIAISVDVELTTMNCGECGGTYAINERYRRQKYEKGGYWNCPYCQCSWGYGESEVARLRKDLDREKTRRSWAEQNLESAREDAEIAERRRVAQKAATTRLKNRVKAGQCPCCRRHFHSLYDHMRNEHPDYDPSADD